MGGALGYTELLGGRLPTMAFTMVQIACAVGLFAWRLERRDRFVLRLCAAACLPALIAVAFWAAYMCLVVPTVYTASVYFWISIIVQVAFFSLIIGYFTWAVTLLFEASPWTALFCCTAGYAVQNFASGLLELLWTLQVGTGVELTAQLDVGRIPLNALCSVVVYLPFYLLIARRLSRRGLEEINEPALLAVMVVVALGVIGFDLVIKNLTEYQGIPVYMVAALRCVHGLLCVMTYALEYELLVSRHLREEAATTERVLAERERQYEASRQNIEAINIKCHDIRHQIRHLQAPGGEAVDAAALADIAREVDVYDCSVRTQNDALDTILTEKRLVCVREGITLSVVADGAALGFMSAAEIYSFFGNALDNAIEAAEKIDDAERRSISVVVRRAAGVVSIHIENRFAPAAAPVTGGDGLLATSKKDQVNHGFGVRSMRLTVERYGGTLATLVQGDTFHVNAMIPER